MSDTTLSSLPPIFGVRRALLCTPPERIPFKALDDVDLLLHRVQGGSRGPMLLAPGTAMTALTYLTDTLPVSFAEYLALAGFDVWLFDWRTSPLLAAHKKPYTLADVARFDWPAAVAEVRKRTGAEQVTILAHCLSSPALFFALIRGHLDTAHVKRIVASQVAIHLRFTPVGATKLGLHLEALLPAKGIVHQRLEDRVVFSICDLAGSLLAQFQPGILRCGNKACYRHAATFGELVYHPRLSDATHAIMGDLVPEVVAGFLKDIGVLGRQDSILSADDHMHIDRLKVPIHFLAGSENRMFVPASTADTFTFLCVYNGPEFYSRKEYARFGHLDFWFGGGAAEEVWPDILAIVDNP